MTATGARHSAYLLLLQPQSCKACGLSQVSSHVGSASGLQTQLQGQSCGLGTRKSQGTSGAGWEPNPPSFPQPPVPFLGEGGHSSSALSQLLQLCSEGSMG